MRFLLFSKRVAPDAFPQLVFNINSKLAIFSNSNLFPSIAEEA
jgi:hypothetical protein